MDRKKRNVLFLCTGNSARSIISEAILNARGSEKFNAYSAGSQPGTNPNPFALDVLRKTGMDDDALRSKSWSEFEGDEAPEMDIVVTVCDNAAKETCPLWPGSPVKAHWSLPDPAAVEGSDSRKTEAFSRTFRMIEKRIASLISLPIDTLDRADVVSRLNDIGEMNDE